MLLKKEKFRMMVRTAVNSNRKRNGGKGLKVGFLSLGCKVNYYETEKMKQQFEQAGYQVVAFGETADVYIINTCTVTNIADRKSRKMLHRARRNNPDAIVAATGCYVDSMKKRTDGNREFLLENEEDLKGFVDLFVSNTEKDKLLKKVEEVQRGRERIKNASSSFPKAEERDRGIAGREALPQKHTRAYVKVQDGCNQYCTYCIIPYVRGALKSRTNAEVVQEVKGLAAEGIREVVITGIHLSSYGVDFTDKRSFTDLQGKPLLELLTAVAAVEGIARIRLGSLEPRIITREFVRALCQIPKVCPHFHLSLQSGCDQTLRRMNRHYTTEEYLECTRILREYFVSPAITTDIIAGFPQETEAEFAATCEFAKKVSFSQIHVFKYSRRHGTMADAMEGQIPEPVKVERSNTLLAIEQELEEAFQQTLYGKVENVLFEELVWIQEAEYLVGYNERYVRIAVKADMFSDAEKCCNTIGAVRVTGRLTGEILLGEMDGCTKKGCFFK